MFYIFANSGKCIAKTAYSPNAADLASRGEVVVEAQEDYDITAILLIDGVIVQKPVPPPTPEEVRTALTDAVQKKLLDATARTRGYDNIITACTYATSKDAVFAGEGQACVEWRDAVWRRCYELLAEVMSGQRGVPTPEELIAELPKMVWPE